MELGKTINMTIAGGATAVLGGEALPKSYGANYSTGNLGEDQVFSAMVTRITPGLGEPATVRQVVWQIDNRVGLLEPGAYRKLRLYANTARKCLAVPVAAFVDESHDRVSVMEADGRLGFRDVTTGVTDGNYIEVISGLQLGDIVITADTEGVAAGTEIELTIEEN